MNGTSTIKDTLVDIRNVNINTALPAKERREDFLRQIKNPYEFRHNNIEIKVNFSEDGKSLSEYLKEYLNMI